MASAAIVAEAEISPGYSCVTLAQRLRLAYRGYCSVDTSASALSRSAAGGLTKYLILSACVPSVRAQRGAGRWPQAGKLKCQGARGKGCHCIRRGLGPLRENEQLEQKIKNKKNWVKRKRKKSHNCSSRSHTPPPGRLPPLCSVFISPGTLLLPRACNLSPDNQNLILNRSSRPQTCVESSPVIGTSSQARSMRDRPYIGAMEGQLSSPPKNSQDPAMIF